MTRERGGGEGLAVVRAGVGGGGEQSEIFPANRMNVSQMKRY